MPPVYDPALHGVAMAAAQMVPVMPSSSAAEDEADEDPSIKKVEMSCASPFNIPAVLAQNLVNSDYYKSLGPMKHFEEVIDEIKAKVDHLQPFMLGKSNLPSSGYCLLYKLFCMKVTIAQMKSMLARKQNPFVRGLGFLFLRYATPSASLWSWFEPHIEDDQPVCPDGGPLKKTEPICNYLQGILTEMKYYGTNFPRIPAKIEQDIKINYLAIETKKQARRERAKKNERLRKYFTPGTRVKAEWSEDKVWYPAVIDELLQSGSFVVTFTEYGNQDEVEIGSIQLVDEDGNPEDPEAKSKSSKSEKRSRSGEKRKKRSTSGDRDGGGRSKKDKRSRTPSRDSRKKKRERSGSRDRDRKRRYSRSSSRSKSPELGDRELSRDELRERLMKQERDKHVASGRGEWAKRPTSYKKELSIVNYGATRTKSPTRGGGIYSEKNSAAHIASRISAAKDNVPRADSGGGSSSRKNEQSDADRMRAMRLKAQYGDATKKSFDAQSKGTRPNVDSVDVIRLGYS